MISVSLEKPLDIFQDGQPLFEAHKKEIDLFGLELDINIDAYERMAEERRFLLFALRNNDELIGYCGYTIFYHLHHQKLACAKQDVVFISKEFRGGTGKVFIKSCDDTLKELGIKTVLQCVPAVNDWSKALIDLGYSELETIYSKSL